MTETQIKAVYSGYRKVLLHRLERELMNVDKYERLTNKLGEWYIRTPHGHEQELGSSGRNIYE